MPPDLAPPPPVPSSRGRIVLSALGLVAAIVIAYLGSLGGPFVFDDSDAIRDNPTIRRLWPLSGPLSPPAASGVGGRPLANLSFALNHALGGDDVRGYHAVNVLLHAASALVLFGIVRRTAGRSLLAGKSSPVMESAASRLLQKEALPLGMAIAAVWALHPLLTGAVSYLSQRTEVLMGLCYLLTLYFFIRGWLAASVVVCALGMASKEVMVTAPVALLLYDRTFVAGTFRAAWAQRRGYYSALAATWLLLAWLLTSGLSQRSVGFGLGVSAASYALTECVAILHYLRLSFWPQPLIFDYGAVDPSGVATKVACAAGIAVLLVATIVTLRRRRMSGFLAAWFFVLLAPSSSFVPVADQPIAENRVYLPLIAVVAALVLALRTVAPRRWTLVVPLFAVLLGTLTAKRNEVFRDPITLWADTVAKRPLNPRAHFNHGVVLLRVGRAAEAATAFETAVRLKPSDATAHHSLGNALTELGRSEAALPHYAEALRLRPTARVHYNHGTALLAIGRARDAVAEFESALRLQPSFAEAHNNLGNAFLELEQPARAIEQYEAALRLQPDLADAYFNLAAALVEVDRPADAIRHYEQFLQLRPNDAEAREALRRLRAK